MIIEEVESESESESEGEGEGEAGIANPSLVSPADTPHATEGGMSTADKATELEATLADLAKKRDALQQERTEQAKKIEELASKTSTLSDSLSDAEKALRAKEGEVDLASRQMKDAQAELGLEELLGAPGGGAATASTDPASEDDFVVVDRDEAVAAPAQEAVFAPPASPFEFLRDLKLTLSDTVGLAVYLQRIPPGSLAKLFSNQLEADHLTAIVAAVVKSYRPKVALQYLESLTTVDRFDMVVMFLPAKELAAVTSMVQGLVGSDECDPAVLKSVLARLG